MKTLLFPFAAPAGVSSSRSTSSQDGHSSATFSAAVSPPHTSTTSVLAAAQTLAMILQQTGQLAPSPDPLTAGLIGTWLETHLPVSFDVRYLPSHNSVFVVCKVVVGFVL